MQSQIPDSELGVTEITDSVVGNHCNDSPVHGESAQRLEHRGEKVNGEVMAPRHTVPQHAFCMLAHDVLNNISAIIGFCDLIEIDQTEAEKQNHFDWLRNTASLIPDMLSRCSCSVGVCPPAQVFPDKIAAEQTCERNRSAREQQTSRVAIQHL